MELQLIIKMLPELVTIGTNERKCFLTVVIHQNRGVSSEVVTLEVLDEWRNIFSSFKVNVKWGIITDNRDLESVEFDLRVSKSIFVEVLDIWGWINQVIVGLFNNEVSGLL